MLELPRKVWESVHIIDCIHSSIKLIGIFNNIENIFLEIDLFLHLNFTTTGANIFGVWMNLFSFLFWGLSGILLKIETSPSDYVPIPG